MSSGRSHYVADGTVSPDGECRSGDRRSAARENEAAYCSDDPDSSRHRVETLEVTTRHPAFQVSLRTLLHPDKINFQGSISLHVVGVSGVWIQ